jgi:hypothetical protein
VWERERAKDRGGGVVTVRCDNNNQALNQSASQPVHQPQLRQNKPKKPTFFFSLSLSPTRTEFVDEVLHVRALGLVGLVEPALVLHLLPAHRLERVVVAAVVRQGLVLELDDVRGHLVGCMRVWVGGGEKLLFKVRGEGGGQDDSRRNPSMKVNT